MLGNCPNRHLHTSSTARAYFFAPASSAQQPRHSPTRGSVAPTASPSLEQPEQSSDGPKPSAPHSAEPTLLAVTSGSSKSARPPPLIEPRTATMAAGEAELAVLETSMGVLFLNRVGGHPGAPGAMLFADKEALENNLEVRRRRACDATSRA